MEIKLNSENGSKVLNGDLAIVIDTLSITCENNIDKIKELDFYMLDNNIDSIYNYFNPRKMCGKVDTLSYYYPHKLGKNSDLSYKNETTPIISGELLFICPEGKFYRILNEKIEEIDKLGIKKEEYEIDESSKVNLYNRFIILWCSLVADKNFSKNNKIIYFSEESFQILSKSAAVLEDRGLTLGKIKR